MSMLPHDINDDEIRIISSESKLEKDTPPKGKAHNKKRRFRIWLWTVIILFICILGVFLWFAISSDNESNEEFEIIEQPKVDTLDPLEPEVESKTIDSNSKGFVEISDTTINKDKLTILKPVNSIPRLQIGAQALDDSAATLVVQAADIRRDNGEIVGAYVFEGDLLSKGQAKAGYCAIINGKIIIGVADSTPYLEQAIETDGYFFRQYPLVVGGQVIENRLKPSSLRKALAELNGEIVVIMTHRKMTLNEFSQLLVDLGVSNAIYLVGSSAFGFAIDEDGNRIEFGKKQENPSKNTNYIIWE